LRYIFRRNHEGAEIGSGIRLSDLGVRTVISTPRIWRFNPPKVVNQVLPTLEKLGYLRQPDLWVFSLGWQAKGELAARFPANMRDTVRKFGKIELIKLRWPPPEIDPPTAGENRT
jgi:hypothetical protein